MPDKFHLRLVVNKQWAELEAYGMARLLDILREDLRLTSVKEGCGEGECGACSVLLNGELVNSCLIPALQADGASVTTIEGLSGNRTLDSVQAAFLDHGGAQCGICTPGMILAAVYMLEKFPEIDEARIREGLAGNLCRCTGYQSIIEAIKHVVPEAQQS